VIERRWVVDQWEADRTYPCLIPFLVSALKNNNQGPVSLIDFTERKCKNKNYKNYKRKLINFFQKQHYNPGFKLSYFHKKK
jgi:hypothetical protein